MQKPILSLILLFLALISCKKEQNPFEISKQHIGFLTDSTQVKELETIFLNDSVKSFIAGDEFAGNKNSIEIFEKGGKKLLVLTPESALDSTSIIENIQIIDPRYKTENGITTKSTFKDISEAYKISKIDNLINSILIHIRDHSVSFVIDKKELPANLRFDMNLKFETTHIPDNAKIKYFFVNWND